MRSRRLLKNPPGGVLASLRDSTYRSVRLVSSLAAALPAERRVLARRGGRVSRAGLFEQPPWRAVLVVGVCIALFGGWSVTDAADLSEPRQRVRNLGIIIGRSEERRVGKERRSR